MSHFETVFGIDKKCAALESSKEREVDDAGPMSRFSVVLAHGPDMQIGAGGKLPWPYQKNDLTRFSALTSRCLRPGMMNAVVMGRKTWESLPRRPLPGRLNVVVTSKHKPEEQTPPDTIRVRTLNAALQATAALSSIHDVFVIGGGQVYAEAFSMTDGIDYVYVTEVTTPEMEAGDVFVEDAPWKTAEFTELYREKVDDSLTFTTYGSTSRRSTSRTSRPDPCINYPCEHEEEQYLRLVDSILRSGLPSSDRTGQGTLSQFGAAMRFSLRGGVIPVLTTKATFFRGVKEELLSWFVPGVTDVRALQTRGVKIWDKNVEAHSATGHDAGPVYGFQWRHFGADYVDDETDYTSQGTDQLAWVIEEIKRNPSSRRLVVSAWNPRDLDCMALPPCHMLFQFYVRDGRLSCSMTQRSADMGLGVPFNIASYALLTCLVAHATSLAPDELVMNFGDAHIYNSHEGPLLEQLSRRPFPFPKLVLAPDTPRDLFAIAPDHVSLDGYISGPRLPMEMAV